MSNINEAKVGDVFQRRGTGKDNYWTIERVKNCWFVTGREEEYELHSPTINAHEWTKLVYEGEQRITDKQWQLGEPLKPGDVVEDGEYYIAVNNKTGEMRQGTVLGSLALGNIFWTYYRDDRPMPTLPEPLPEPPKWLNKAECLGVVDTGYFTAYVLSVWPKAEEELVLAYDDGSVGEACVADCTLIDHPDYPPTPELRALFDESEAQQ